MLLSEARTILAQGGLQVTIGDGSGNTYSYTQADDAIKYVGNDFVQRLPGITQTIGTIGTAGFGTTYELTLTSLTDFYADGPVRITVVDSYGVTKSVKRTDYDTVRREHERQGTTAEAGVPTAVAFAPGMVLFDTAPGTHILRVNVWYNPPFTTWTSGGTAAGTVSLNIPDRYIYPVVHDGAAAVLQLSDPNARSQSEGWKRYEAHTLRVRGMVGVNKGVVVANEREFI